MAILATGDELLPPERYDEVRAGAGVPESNGPMLAAAITMAGAEPRLLPTAPDDVDALKARLEEGLSSDVIVTIGGASMGEADLVKRVLDDLGFALDFWRVKIRPGSPFSFGLLPGAHGPTPVFGLPGNPASAFVTFELFVRPFLRRLGGHTSCSRRRIVCTAGAPLSGPAALTYFLRVRLAANQDGQAIATPTGPQGSGLVRGLGTAQGLAIVPEQVERIEAGAPVEVILLDAGDAVAPGSPS